MTTIRKAEKRDLNKILELNEESVHFLSPLNMEKLEHLVSQSEVLEVVEVDGEVEAFILTIIEGKDYDSVNYLWFAERYERFLYIDRVVVSVKMHGKGLGGMLYKSIFEYAKQKKIPFVTAEIDINPPNPGSLRFHEKNGFSEVGKQTVADGKKIVSLQAVAMA
ncbi:MAG TPA: GNAT family N-acetyltransferase [Clostridiales bacterium UBA8960]|nr:GNAT family N-acetyltransferase [Clostridiales bacterium UBA8960]